ncbi:hypothetical protein TNCV_3184971 [Trichonephila clavipes]|nr:hypothetical protein TNCV_3184971 [Trichonephila clavipes]
MNSLTHHEKIRRKGPKRDCLCSDFHKRILFSDEAHFWLNGYVNKQNCRIWSEANPQVYVETTVTSRKTDCFWCALWAGGIIGRTSSKSDEAPQRYSQW